jgi:hypothetical protein
MVALGDGIDLIADAVVDRELVGKLPLILRIECPDVFANGGRIQVLGVFFNQLRKAKQKISPGSECIRGCYSVIRSQAASEVEAAARAVGVLRLEVIDGVMLDLHAVAGRVLPLDPAQVCGSQVGVVPELEWIGVVWIPQG